MGWHNSIGTSHQLFSASFLLSSFTPIIIPCHSICNSVWALRLSVNVHFDARAHTNAGFDLQARVQLADET